MLKIILPLMNLENRDIRHVDELHGQSIPSILSNQSSTWGHFFPSTQANGFQFLFKHWNSFKQTWFYNHDIIHQRSCIGTLLTK